MVPPLSPQQAADFYAELLGDVLAASARTACELGLTPILAVDPPEAVRELSAQAPSGFRVTAQRGEGLAERMDWAIRETAAGGFDRILLRGSDSPTLESERIGAALRSLDEFDLALSPDLDGGYNLIGLRRAARGLFAHAMSTRTVLADTLRAAEELGLRAHLQQASFDIDTVEDLGLLAAVRSGPQRQSVTILCPRTIAYLDSERLWPEIEPGRAP
jgi:hypothetical protein